MSEIWTNEVVRPEFLSALEAFARRRKRCLAGPSTHGDPSRVPRACGLDWLDHRPYEFGDDLRHVDRHVTARTGKPYVRRFAAERGGRLDLLVDCSRSMGEGHPSKLDCARTLAFAIGYVSLVAGERLSATFVADRIVDRLAVGRGNAHQARLLQFLREAHERGRTDIGNCIEVFAGTAREVGRVVVISDLLDGNVMRGFRALRRRGFRTAVVRVRCMEDEQPNFRRHVVTVVDSETGSRRRVSWSLRDRTLYYTARRAEKSETGRSLEQLGIPFAAIGNWLALRDLAIDVLARPGWLD